MALSSKMAGGDTHIKYGHFHYPRIVETICPYCAKPSRSINTNVPNEIEHFINIAGFKLEWVFSCTYCLKRQTKTWEDINKLQLLNKTKINSEIVWAWNTNHLDYLIDFFGGKNNTQNKWAFFKTYIHKNWLKNIKKSSHISKLSELSKRNKAFFKL